TVAKRSSAGNCLDHSVDTNAPNATIAGVGNVECPICPHGDSLRIQKACRSRRTIVTTETSYWAGASGSRNRAVTCDPADAIVTGIDNIEGSIRRRGQQVRVAKLRLDGRPAVARMTANAGAGDEMDNAR